MQEFFFFFKDVKSVSESFIGNVAVQTQQSDASHRFDPPWLLY